jgi:type II secretory pathway pseudopilin PulG
MNDSQKNVLTSIKKKLAFTLAEVLIVVGIIGIIAEITIPTLINDIQKNVSMSVLKEDYSMINQVLTQAASESGGDFAELFAYASTPTTDSYESIVTNFVTKNIIPYVKMSRNCGYTTAFACKGDLEYYLNGSAASDAYMYKYIIFLNNGSSLAFIPDNYLGYWTSIIINVDTNGNKKPNTYGKDLFQMRFSGTSKKILFFGSGNTRADLLGSSTNGCNKSSAGMYCGALIMQDGWQVADDYPWN